MAADVKHSFDTLMSKQAAPQYRVVLGDVKQAVVTGERTVRFDFKRASAELPLMVGGLPVFSRAWGAGKPFDQVVMDMPIASGPYKIGRLNFGRDITYERDPDYWARDLNVRRGLYNFDRITYKIYKDNTAQTEAFKAGEFDYIQVFSARDWARTYIGKKFDSGELIKAELPTKNAGDFQGFLINTRREKFKDPRVREALGARLRLRVDEPAADVQLVHARARLLQRQRLRGEGAARRRRARGLAAAARKLPEKVFTEEVPLPPSTNPPDSLRDNLRKARELLAEAGWTYRDGALRNAKGEPFTLEYLDSGGGERVVAPYFQALGKLGIEGEYRRADFALIQKRLDVFDFDLFTVRIPGNESPGSELLDRFGSESADTEGSSNLIGVQDPAVDALVEPGGVGAHAAGAGRAPARARPRAAPRPLRRPAVVLRAPIRVAYRVGQVRAARGRAAVLLRPRTG